MNKKDEEYDTKCIGCKLYYPKEMVDNDICLVCGSTLPIFMLKKLYKRKKTK